VVQGNVVGSECKDAFAYAEVAKDGTGEDHGGVIFQAFYVATSARETPDDVEGDNRVVAARGHATARAEDGGAIVEGERERECLRTPGQWIVDFVHGERLLC
jgi:hypothetical protein